MNAKDLKFHLKSILEEGLIPLIDNDYVYWDLPYHINIGDTLIWQGTLDFLKNLNVKMLNSGNSETANFKKISKNQQVILLHGGGNFGDIYGSSQNFRKKVVQNYPNNKIIILPQTIYFKDKAREREDLTLFSQHENLYLCVRDQASYDLATLYLNQDRVLLLPDMAFCIDEKYLTSKKNIGKSLLMNRIDVEAIELNKNNFDMIDVESDWPTFEKKPLYSFILRGLLAANRRLSNNGFLAGKIDKFASGYVKNQLITTGIGFINSFDTIYTTRLHGCILSLLLDKKIILLDNSYGKNTAFYNAWLKGSDNIKVESC